MVKFRINKHKSQLWLQRGYYHRIDGPALIHTNGNISWRQNGKKHRDDGPAMIWSDGTETWYENGRWIKNVQV